MWKIIVILFSIQHKLRLCTEAKKSRTAHTHIAISCRPHSSQHSVLYTPQCWDCTLNRNSTFFLTFFLCLSYVSLCSPSLNLLSQQHASLWLLICYHCFSLIGIFVWLCFSFCKRIALSSVCHYLPPPPTVVLAIFLLLDFCCHNNYNSKVSHSLLCDVWVVVSSGLVRTLSVHTTVWYKCVLQHERCGGTYNKIKQPLRMTTDFQMRLRRNEGGVVYNQTYDSRRRRRPPVKQIKPTNILIKLFVFGWFLAH